MLTHVVVTVYTDSEGRVITHAYGPYTAGKANAERRKILDNVGWTIGEDESLRVSACKMIDVDRMNREL